MLQKVSKNRAMMWSCFRVDVHYLPWNSGLRKNCFLRCSWKLRPELFVRHLLLPLPPGHSWREISVRDISLWHAQERPSNCHYVLLVLWRLCVWRSDVYGVERQLVTCTAQLFVILDLVCCFVCILKLLCWIIKCIEEYKSQQCTVGMYVFAPHFYTKPVKGGVSFGRNTHFQFNLENCVVKRLG